MQPNYYIEEHTNETISTFIFFFIQITTFVYLFLLDFVIFRLLWSLKNKVRKSHQKYC